MRHTSITATILIALILSTSITVFATTSTTSTKSLPEKAQETVAAAKEAQDQVTGAWDRMNAWMKRSIGLSISDVLHVIGNVLIWIIGFVIQILQAILRSLQWVMSHV